LIGVTAGLAMAGCRGDDTAPVSPVDLSHPAQDLATSVPDNGDMATTNPTDDMGTTKGACATFNDTTIAAMRGAAKSGCYRLGMMAPVVVLAQNASSKTGTLVVQDVAGGDNSALLVSCKTSGMPPCTVLSSIASLTPGAQVNVLGLYIKPGTTGFEVMYLDDQPVAPNGTATPPAPLTVALADVANGATTLGRPKYFQKVDVTIPAGTTVNAYDWAPAPFKPTNWSACTSLPYTFGFGLIPSSSSGAATPGPACTMGMMPMPAPNPSADEILISTNFYKSFPLSSDCQCTKTAADLLTAGKTFTKLSGILNVDTGHLQIEPTASTDLQ
jgi:hypothetical protein